MPTDGQTRRQKQNETDSDSRADRWTISDLTDTQTHMKGWGITQDGLGNDTRWVGE